jgi:hypothetical protein
MNHFNRYGRTHCNSSEAATLMTWTAVMHYVMPTDVWWLNSVSKWSATLMLDEEASLVQKRWSNESVADSRKWLLNKIECNGRLRISIVASHQNWSKDDIKVKQPEKAVVLHNELHSVVMPIDVNLPVKNFCGKKSGKKKKLGKKSALTFVITDNWLWGKQTRAQC